MASESLNTLLKSIGEANTKISNRLGLLDTHITAIITAGKALLAKIKTGTLLPDQIAQIYRDEEDGEVSYQLQMAILDIDLEGL